MNPHTSTRSGATRSAPRSKAALAAASGAILASSALAPSTWALQDAKARFSELARLAMSEGPQHVTLRGEPALVVLSEAEYAALTNKGKALRRRTWADLFAKSPFPPVELDLERSRDVGRTIEF